ncbi:MAG: hypothetical protein JOY61_13745, partial [Chloroflexi bacterium]|nr:hypothetical protein [Chloroflexota bacterium]
MIDQPNSPRRGRGGATAAILAVALVGAVIGVAVDRYAIGDNLTWPDGSTLPTLTSVPRIGPIAAPNGESATPTTAQSSDPTQAAIEQVIQKGDQEQVQAVANKDMSVMTDTATADFYQQQQRTTQDLVDNGVTAISLLKIEWGDVQVNGNSATATAWETWSTSYSDGTTEQSRDRNVYTLVNDNGTWKVSADDHPDEAAGGVPGTGNPAPGNPNPRQPNPGNPNPRQPNPDNPNPGQPRPGGRDTSQNWAGYAATGGTFTAVTGTWTVPQFTPDSQPGADATWVGIGGVTSRDLIQAGTQQTVSGNGTTQYETWVETLPQASHPVPLTINPGDSVTISITQQQTPDQWTVDYKNNTTGQTFSANETYQSSLSSAEWIEESPSSLRNRQLPLDNFGTV